MNDSVTSHRNESRPSPSPNPTVKSGVRGWLLLLCLMLTVVGPVIALGLMGAQYEDFAPYLDGSPRMEFAMLVSMALTIGSAVFGAYAGFGLWVVRPRAVAVAKNALLLGLAVDIVCTALRVAVSPMPSAEGEFFNDVAFAVVPGLIFFTLCFAYLNKSARVEATYRS